MDVNKLSEGYILIVIKQSRSVNNSEKSSINFWIFAKNIVFIYFKDAKKIPSSFSIASILDKSQTS
jgi:hypothetical protein